MWERCGAILLPLSAWHESATHTCSTLNQHSKYMCTSCLPVPMQPSHPKIRLSSLNKVAELFVILLLESMYTCMHTLRRSTHVTYVRIYHKSLKSDWHDLEHVCSRINKNLILLYTYMLKIMRFVRSGVECEEFILLHNTSTQYYGSSPIGGEFYHERLLWHHHPHNVPRTCYVVTSPEIERQE